MFQPVDIYVHVIAHYGHCICEALESLTQTFVDFLFIGITLDTLCELIEGVAISKQVQ